MSLPGEIKKPLQDILRKVLSYKEFRAIETYRNSKGDVVREEVTAEDALEGDNYRVEYIADETDRAPIMGLSRDHQDQTITFLYIRRDRESDPKVKSGYELFERIIVDLIGL
jgi:hypothetical protein